MSGNVVDNLIKGSKMNSVIENHLALRSTNSQLDQYCALPDIALKPRDWNKVKIQTNNHTKSQFCPWQPIPLRIFTKNVI